MTVNLSALLPPPRVSELGNGSAPVYGLTLVQLSALLEQHSAEVSKFLETTTPDVASLARVLPELAVKIIAMGLRSEGQEDVIRNQMPLATQLEVLMDIWEASVPDSKKLVARLSGLLAAAKSLAVNPSLSPSESPSPPELTTSFIKATDYATSGNTP